MILQRSGGCDVSWSRCPGNRTGRHSLAIRARFGPNAAAGIAEFTQTVAWQEDGCLLNCCPRLASCRRQATPAIRLVSFGQHCRDPRCWSEGADFASGVFNCHGRGCVLEFLHRLGHGRNSAVGPAGRATKEGEISASIAEASANLPKGIFAMLPPADVAEASADLQNPETVNS